MAGIDLSHLELQEVIGKGGQGIVYRGRIGDADVAIKVIAPATHTGAEQIAQRLGRFARAGGGSSVAAVLAHGILKDAPTQLSDQLRDMPREAIYLVMPYLPQGTLADLPRPVSERTAVAALSLVADALGVLPVGVFHGDLSAANVAVRGQGSVVLLDPDLTREPSAEDDLRALGGLILDLTNGASGPTAEQLRNLASQLAGQPPLPKLSEVRSRLREIATSVGATDADLSVPTRRPRPEGAKATEASKPQPAWRRPVAAAALLGCIAFGPFAVMRSPLRPPPRTVLVTDSPALSSDKGVYDTTGTVRHAKVVSVLDCADKIDMLKVFLEVSVEEPVARVAILSFEPEPHPDAVKDFVHMDDEHHVIYWEQTDPPLHANYCFDLVTDKYLFEQDRLLPNGQLQADQKKFDISLEHPRRLYTTADMHLAPLSPAAIAERKAREDAYRAAHPWWERLFKWWWSGFEQ